MRIDDPNSKEKTEMDEKVVVNGEIVDAEEEVVEEIQVDSAEEGKVEILAPLRDDFESDEEFNVASEQHEKDNTPELEPWQETGDEEYPDVPAATHVRKVKKLKGRISERDEENERLKAENKELREGNQKQKQLKRPIPEDFDTDELYQTALGEHETDIAEARYDKIETDRNLKLSAEKARKELSEAVETHYTRASELVEKSGIKPEIYKKADENVRAAVETVIPKNGDLITDQIISILGEGSEKVMYFLGNNTPARNQFQTLLMEDKTGMKAAVYLGQQKERLTNPKKMTTKTPAPSPKVDGDETVSAKGGTFKKRYDKAHKEGKLQLAYNAKKEARSAGVDVSVW